MSFIPFLWSAPRQTKSFHFGFSALPSAAEHFPPFSE